MPRLILLLISLLISSSFITSARENEIKVGLRTGHNAALGCFGAASVETIQTFSGNFSIHSGIQYNTIGKTSIEAHPAYHMPLGWGKLSIESVLTYTNLSSINGLTAGVGAALDSKNVGARLGYYYHLYGGHGGRITEPFNVYYELCGHFLKKVDNWNLDLKITNCETFELERHFQPSFIAEGSFYPTSKLGVSFGIGCKPSGMFNMSADYYQSYIKTGVCYRW